MVVEGSESAAVFDGGVVEAAERLPVTSVLTALVSCNVGASVQPPELSSWELVGGISAIEEEEGKKLSDAVAITSVSWNDGEVYGDCDAAKDDGATPNGRGSGVVVVPTIAKASVFPSTDNGAVAV